ncbi:MAG: 50S ribosomal protein L1 [Phycisphaerales bacterium]|nr:50S ribosomal protein L1 [Phycisphaerales bacterium]
MSEEHVDTTEATQEEAVESNDTPTKTMTEEASSWKARLRRRRRRTPSGRKRSNRDIAAENRGPHSPAEAVKVLKQFKQPKFDQAVECCVHLGIDPRQADQQLRGATTMPHGTGKSARVVCFCSDDKVEAVKAAGAVEAGSDDLGEKIKGGWFDFDIAIASPDMMRVVGQLGRVLGPKGLMPSPKAGTVTPDVETAVAEFAAGKAEYRNDDGGNLHIIIGRMGFTEDQLTDNLQHFLTLVENARPASVKGIYVKKCVISGTMTPGVEVEVS